MIKTSRLPAVLLTAATSSILSAQAPTLEQRVQRLEEQLSQAPAAMEAAHSTAPQDAPKVGSKVDLNFWGRANFQATYDNFQDLGGLGGADFMTYLTGEGNEQFNFNPRDTRLGFGASSSSGDWTGKAVFEIDFYGANSGANLLPRMRLGYAEIAHKNGFSLRCGQDWTPIAQQNPGTLDFGIMAWGGNLWNRDPQITARFKQGDFEYLLSLVHFRVAGGQDQEERMPWVVGRVAYTCPESKGLFALGGGYRENNIDNGSASVDVTSYMVAAEAKMPLGDMVNLTAELWTGEAIGREFLRSGLDYNAAGNEIAGSGGFVSVEWKLDDHWSVNFGAGLDQPHDEDTGATTFFGTTTPYDSNRTAFANIRYQFNKNAGIGVEVIDFQTEQVDGGVYGNGGQVLRGQRFTIGSWFVF